MFRDLLFFEFEDVLSLCCRDGNAADIARSGGMTPFLIELHKEHGPIASFWMKQEFIISLASPELLKEVAHLRDRPGTVLTCVRDQVLRRDVPD